MISTPYTTVSDEILAKAKQIKLLICDVDGILSDGKIYMGNQGEELKTFHTKDGFGLKALLNEGIEVAVITGRQSKIVTDRMNALSVKYIYQGQGDKTHAFNELLSQLKLTHDQIAYIGDDVIDIPVMKLSGLSVAVSDAHPLVKQIASYVTVTKGGEGAVRECCDLILQAIDKLDMAQGVSV